MFQYVSANLLYIKVCCFYFKAEPLKNLTVKHPSRDITESIYN